MLMGGNYNGCQASIEGRTRWSKGGVHGYRMEAQAVEFHVAVRAVDHSIISGRDLRTEVSKTNALLIQIRCSSFQLWL
jgi:hypothetical protein